MQVLQRRLPEFHKLGANLVAVTPERPDLSLTTREKHDLQFEVLSDTGNQVARQFGLVYPVGGKIRKMFDAFGVDLAADHGSEEWELPMPGSFVIDGDGLIRFAFAKAVYTQRAEPDELLEVVRSL